MCTVAGGLPLKGLVPTQQVTGLALNILTNADVLSMWPELLFWLHCKQCYTACILNFILNVAPHCLCPYYEMVVLRMQDSLPFDKGSGVELSYNNISLCDNSSLVFDILL